VSTTTSFHLLQTSPSLFLFLSSTSINGRNQKQEDEEHWAQTYNPKTKLEEGEGNNKESLFQQGQEDNKVSITTTLFKGNSVVFLGTL